MTDRETLMQKLATEIAVETLIAQRDRYRAELEEAHTWLLAYGMCDCEDRGYEGKVRCRFAEALETV